MSPSALEYLRRQYLKKKYPVSTGGVIAAILTIILIIILLTLLFQSIV